jgi:hypothetical protein
MSAKNTSDTIHFRPAPGQRKQLDVEAAKEGLRISDILRRMVTKLLGKP